MLLSPDFGGAGDESRSGDATGGDGDGRGPGGNARTGNTGSARGGSIFNEGGSVDSTDGASTLNLCSIYIMPANIRGRCSWSRW